MECSAGAQDPHRPRLRYRATPQVRCLASLRPSTFLARCRLPGGTSSLRVPPKLTSSRGGRASSTFDDFSLVSAQALEVRTAAACLTEVEAAQALLDRALAALVAGQLSPADAAMVKLFTSEMQARVVDRALQIFGGYGYMLEYPIARLYTDARVTRIYGGTSEVMKLIISKSMGL